MKISFLPILHQKPIFKALKMNTHSVSKIGLLDHLYLYSYNWILMEIAVILISLLLSFAYAEEPIPDWIKNTLN